MMTMTAASRLLAHYQRDAQDCALQAFHARRSASAPTASPEEQIAAMRWAQVAHVAQHSLDRAQEGFAMVAAAHPCSNEPSFFAPDGNNSSRAVLQLLPSLSGEQTDE